MPTPSGWCSVDCKRQLDQGSFVLLYFRLSTFSDLYWVCLSVFFCTVLFVSISQVIGCEDHLRNDLYCVEWGVKLCSNQPWLIVSASGSVAVLVQSVCCVASRSTRSKETSTATTTTRWLTLMLFLVLLSTHLCWQQLAYLHRRLIRGSSVLLAVSMLWCFPLYGLLKQTHTHAPI